jgi:LacI family transcriptional regulator
MIFSKLSETIFCFHLPFLKECVMLKKKGGIHMVTLEDIARELGISKGTVSKALHGAKDVSLAMQQTVLKKAAEMGYARLPAHTTASRTALFVTNMEYLEPDDFGYQLIAGFCNAAQKAGYLVDVIPLTHQMQILYRYDDYMRQGNYCGGFFLGLSLRQDPWLKEFETCTTPTVLYDNHIASNPNVAYIGTDNLEGMDLAVKYLKSLGHTTIGYLSYEMHAFIYIRRYYAFTQALQQNGLRSDLSLCGSDHHVSECLARHLPRLLEQGCTAIVCSHDILAHSVMVYCAELGLRVPDDVSILGFDDIPLCRYTIPPLTTIRQDRINLGKSAFSALTSLMNHVAISSLLLHAELIQRSSCCSIQKK